MNESGGNKRKARTRRGNPWIRRALCQSAWVVSRQKDCYLTAVFGRHTRKAGRQVAVVASAHQILVIAYCLVRDSTVYRELGGDHFCPAQPSAGAEADQRAGGAAGIRGEAGSHRGTRGTARTRTAAGASAKSAATARRRERWDLVAGVFEGYKGAPSEIQPQGANCLDGRRVIIPERSARGTAGGK